MSRIATMNDAESTSNEAKKRFQVWALVPVLLLGGSLTLISIMVSISTSDPGFAVEANYYQKAVDWDSHRAQQASSAKLAWQVRWRFEGLEERGTSDHTASVTLALFDKENLPIENAHVEIATFANARAARIEVIDVRETRPGTYQGRFDLHRAGLWRFRLKASHAGQSFTTEIAPEFPSTKLSRPVSVE